MSLLEDYSNEEGIKSILNSGYTESQESDISHPTEITDPEYSSVASAKNNDIVHIFANDDLIKRILVRGNSFFGKPQFGFVAVLDLEGKVADTDLSIRSYENLHVVLGELDIVTGLDAAIQTMEKGEKAEVFVHRRYGHRQFACKEIPPNSDLEFVVHLKDFFSMPYKKDPELCIKICEKKKETANQYYKDVDFVSSRHVYNSALKHLKLLDSKESTDLKNTILSNLSIVLIKLQEFPEALKSLEEITLVSHMDSRFYYRKSQCLQAMNRYNAALSVSEIGLSLFPFSHALRRDVTNIRNILKSNDLESQQFFKKMFSSSQKQPSSANSNLYSIAYGCAVLAVGAGLYFWRRM